MTFIAAITEFITCITIGYGSVAPIHHDKLSSCNVKPVGIIETNADKHDAIRKKGLRVCDTYEEALELTPDFWDICCPVNDHVTVIENIIALDPHARIIVEKPICNFEEIPKLQRLLKNFLGKIVVNENYLSSATTQKIKDLVMQHGVVIQNIYIEMDKNRTRDFQAGRYVDAKGAFYYEGTHMITILGDIIDKYTPTGEIAKKYEDLEASGKKWERQGLAEIEYNTDELSIHLFTSMKGDIKHSYPPFNLKNIPIDATATRYRIAAVKGINPLEEEITVVGFFEPIQGYKRSQSAVAVLKNNAVIEYIGPLEDDAMGSHLKRAVDYLMGESDRNPCSPEEGIEMVHVLNTLSP